MTIPDTTTAALRPGFAARLPALAAAIALSSASVLTAAAPEASRADGRPNILWIIMDDAGIEMPCHGEKAISTPNIDRLVREGTRFERAFLTASVCSPSRSAMITGMYQTSIGAHQHRSGRGAEKIRLPAGVEPVPAIFQRAGYHTSNGGYPGRNQRIGKTDYNFEWDARMYDASDWKGRRPGQPFFAQLQFWGGKNRNDNGTWYREVAPRELGTLTPVDKVILPPYYPRDPVILADWAQYLDCIRYCDRLLGQVLARLESEGELERTLIIFMGDNGISNPREKQFLYDGGIRTPFIVRGPGIARGAVRTDLIEHIDMAAISLGRAGIPVPAWMQGRDVFARDYRRRDAAFAARDRCDETVDHIRSVRTERFKYIRNFLPQRPHLQPNVYKDKKPVLIRLRELRSAGRLDPLSERVLFSPTRAPEELYDTEADPFEIDNLASDPRHRATLEALRGRLDRWIAETGDRGRESDRMYDSAMAEYLGEQRKSPDQVRLISENIALMKRWAAEGK